MAISPSRLSNSTWPISRRYMRTGSSVRPTSSSLMLPVFFASNSVLSSLSDSSSKSSSSSLTVTPWADRAANKSSIASAEVSACGMASFTSSKVTCPRSLAFLTSALTAALMLSMIGFSAPAFSVCLLSAFAAEVSAMVPTIIFLADKPTQNASANSRLFLFSRLNRHQL